jgi:VIT1/CCC1 family predicted Fe2+/Mn2+ transporter
LAERSNGGAGIPFTESLRTPRWHRRIRSRQLSNVRDAIAPTRWVPYATFEDAVDRSDAKRYRANFQDEIDSASVYRAMAKAEREPRLATVYTRLAETEERHAAFWSREIETATGRAPEQRPSARARMLAWLAQRFGARMVLPTVSAHERANQYGYDKQSESTAGMRGQERSHARLLKTIESTGAGIEGPQVARLEGRHRAVGGNALRAAVLGANDGLVSSLSLVMGVAGASMSEHAILVTGLAGLLAGACSMAMGEWVSVQSSRELFERQMRVEEAEIATIPDEEREELALIYMAKGLPDDEARALAARLMQSRSTALDAMAREELGIDPSEMSGSPWTAAGISFVLFSIGAIAPVLPFAFARMRVAEVISLAASAILLFAIGAAITLFTGRGMVRSGMRQLAIGLGAAGVTFVLGRLVGAHLG